MKNNYAILKTLHSIAPSGCCWMRHYGNLGVSYAGSDDGIVWEKPVPGFETQDGRGTTIVIPRNREAGQTDALPYFCELVGVHMDTRAPGPDERRRMGLLHQFTSQQRPY